MRQAGIHYPEIMLYFFFGYYDEITQEIFLQGDIGINMV